MPQDWMDWSLALSDKWLPFLTIVAGLIATYLKLRMIQHDISGRMTEYLRTTEAKGKAEGKLEGMTTPPAVVVVPPAAAVVSRHPGARTRHSDGVGSDDGVME